jgi:hypothetical protein
METKKMSLRILIGLPVILGLACGGAFVAARWSESLASTTPSGLTADESTSEITTEPSLLALDQITDDFVRTLETRWTGNLAQHRAVATQTVASLCNVFDHQQLLVDVPAGRIRDEWTTMLATLEQDPARAEICSALPANTRTAAAAAFGRDRDLDLLNDVAEEWYGTSPTIADTDGDGFSDTEEITNGFSPLATSSE